MLYTLLWAVGGLPTAPTGLPAGWLHRQPAVDQAYEPRAGDLVLFEDGKLLWAVFDLLARTRPPDHIGIVVDHPDGSVRLLESGPSAQLWVYLLDVPGRLHRFEGTIYVRRLRSALTPEQSARLTEFALAQEGKRYALVRFMRQATPFRTRGPLRSHFAKTSYDRNRWICSELVAAALAYAGLIDPKTMPANAVYPRDFLDNRYCDLQQWEDGAPWSSVPGCLHPVK